MKTGFYLKLALQNLRKNYRFFIPRILTEIGLVGSYYIVHTLANDDRLTAVKGGDYLPTFMGIGTVIIAILSVILIFYSNSFLMKQRKREFGLYNVLSMEKRHMGRVLFHESFLTSLIGITLGLVWGVVFYKLFSLLICRILQTEVVIGFYFIKAKELALAAGGFLVIDALSFLFNRITLQRLNPIELLKSTASGEKEPKIKWILFVLGLGCLGAGYTISLTTENPLDAILLFFLAVLLVIFGTYFLFVAGSLFILKCLKKNQHFYYRKKHMTAVSGLLYRMKQNAVGLASIAILSTGVLVMISSTVTLYSSIDANLQTNFPKDSFLAATLFKQDGTRETFPMDELETIVRKTADSYGIEIKSIERQPFFSVTYKKDGTSFSCDENVFGTSNFQSAFTMYIITRETYESLSGRSLPLQSGEAALIPLAGNSIGDDEFKNGFSIANHDFLFHEAEGEFPLFLPLQQTYHAYGLVVENETVLLELFEEQRAAYDDYASQLQASLAICYKDRDAVAEVINQLTLDQNTLVMQTGQEIPDYAGFSWTNYNYWETRSSFLEIYGTLLFLGILLGLVCLFATVLIIYYKQISEGFEDRERFQILEKIGMSTRDIKSTIRRQVLLVFFLPLLVAGIHVAFAYPMLSKLMSILLLSDPMRLVRGCIITYLAFSLVYALIYYGTARTYYKIVH